MSSQLLIEKEDLELLHSRNYHLIFCVGPRGAGKKSQIEKISNEFHYSRLYLNEAIQKEISSQTKLGLMAKEFVDKNEPIKTEVVVAILARGIIECKELSILIVDFPGKLEHAKYFEQKIMPINLILKFNCKEEICLKRLNEEVGLNISVENYKIEYENTEKDLKELYDVYKPYSLIREINSDNSIT